MDNVGPELELLLHRLADCPAEFYQLPIRTRSKKGHRQTSAMSDLTPIDAVAIVCDHLRDLQSPLSAIQRTRAAIENRSADEQQLVAIAVWLFREQWFMSRPKLNEPIRQLLSSRLQDLARTIRPASTVTDPDRREELVRRCLSELGLRPDGETPQQALDRLNTLDSVERIRVVAKTRAAEARARKIREAMAKKRAQEAAARYSPE